MATKYYSESEYATIEGILRNFWSASYQGPDTIENQNYYNCIPLNLNFIIEQFTFARDYFKPEYRSKLFLDIGCGQGHILLAARAFGFCPFGIEYNLKAMPHWAHPTPMSKIKPSLFKSCNPKENIIHGDALNFTHYGKFDILYLYRPIRDSKLMSALLDKVILSAKPGAIIIANDVSDCIDSFTRQHKSVIKQVSRNIYLKSKKEV